MATEKVDVVVVGSGPGGYVAAIRAAQLGQKVAVVEADRPGGICLNWGCIPTKALLRNAEVLQLFRRAAEFGVTVENLRADYAVAHGRSRQVSERMSKGVEFLFRKNKITLVPGRGELVGPGRGAGDGGRRERPHARGSRGHPGHRGGAEEPARRRDRRNARDQLGRDAPARPAAALGHRDRGRRGRGRVRRRLRGLRRRGHCRGGAAAPPADRGRGDLEAPRAQLRQAEDRGPRRRQGPGRPAREGTASPSRSSTRARPRASRRPSS